MERATGDDGRVKAEPRVLRRDEWDGWYGTLIRAFGGVPEAAEVLELYRELTQVDRSIGVREGDGEDGAWVGTAGAFAFRMTVPGGARVSAAGVTMVSVAATHRRRGVLTSMMRRQLDDVRAWGEPLAVLTASEPAIYGRFGYGAATFALNAEIDTSRVRLSVPAGTDDVRLRYEAPADVLDACEAVYARLVAGRPGMLARRPGWERMALLDPESGRDGASPLQCVVARRGGEVTGYARFRVRSAWGPGGPQGTVVLDDLAGLDPATDAALWRFLYDIDLTSTLQQADIPACGPGSRHTDGLASAHSRPTPAPTRPTSPADAHPDRPGPRQQGRVPTQQAPGAPLSRPTPTPGGLTSPPAGRHSPRQARALAQ
ncbi:GNAT family N-acetyltransferase [Streptomyces violaceorubidus]